MPNPWRGSASDLLPLLAIEETHFIALDGRLGRILACTGLNLGIASDEGADQAAALFANVLNYLPGDARLQLLAANRAVRAEDWVPRHLAQYQRADGLDDYVALLGRAYTGELTGRALPDLQFHAVISLPGPPPLSWRLARRFRRRRILARGREQYARALADLEQAAAALGQALAELGVRTTPLGRQGTIDLLWHCANPDWSRDASAPRADGRGVRGPADLRALRERLAQSRLTRRADYLRLDWGYETTISLRALPETTFPGWLAQLTATGLQFRLALHVAPLDKARERRALGRVYRQRHGILRERASKGLPADFEQEQAHGEAEELLRAMSTGDLRTFRTAVFVTVRAESPQALAAATGRVVRALGDAGGTSVDRCQLWQVPAWQATLPLAENPAGMVYRTITPNLADSLPFLRHGAGTRGGPLIGFAQPGHEAVTLDLHDPALDNGNLICVGTSGSGKTLFAQAYALKHLALGGRVIVLDRSLQHWDDLARAVGGETHRVGLDSGFRINPWQLPPGAAQPGQGKLEYLLDLHTLLLGDQHDGAPQLGADERALLERACRAVYAAVPRPQERDLHEWLVAQASSPDVAPEQRRRCRALAERLTPYVGAGTYAGLLDGPTTVSPDASLAIFNFKGLADRLVPLALLPMIEHVWATIADPSRPTLLVLDEGWKLLDHPASARFVAEVARTGRHHGLVTLNLSQFVTDYTGPTGSAVLENAAVALLLAQPPRLLPQVQQIFGLSDDERAAVARLRTVKGEHAGAYLHARSGADAGVVRLYVTPEEYWLCTSHPPERLLRRAAIAHYRGDVWAAVRALAAMTPAEREALAARVPTRDGADERSTAAGG